MKITLIQIDNFLGARKIDVRLNTAVTLFTGHNGEGKSSINEAVRMAMCQDVARVRLKKEYEQLVTDGSKAGGALIKLDDDRSYAFNVPKGDFEADDDLPRGPNVEVSLNGQRFAGMTADERRTFLFTLAKVKPSLEEVKKRLAARNCDPAKVEQTLPLIRSGFPSASEFAAKAATSAKGAWRALTGKNWGAVQAEGWVADAPAELEGSAPTAEVLAALDGDIAEANQKIGEVAQQVRARADRAKRRAELEKKAGSVKRCQEALDAATKTMNEFEPQVIALRQRAAGDERVGLIHRMARALAEMINLPQDIGRPEYMAATRALDEYEDEHGELLPAGSVDVDAKNSLVEYERGLEVMKNAVKNCSHDLEQAVAAKGEFDALAAPKKEEALPDVGVLQAGLAKMREERAAMQEQMAAFAGHAAAVAAAEAKTRAAEAHHQDVLSWLALADALAPGGIPGELLDEALVPINGYLAEMAGLTDWRMVAIGTDMSITAAGRPYHLLSESEKWRCDAMIAAAAAHLSGIKILMLDRVDVLDIPSRTQLLNWVESLAADGDLDTILLFATLKSPPGKLIPSMTAHWVENGSVAELKVAA